MKTDDGWVYLARVERDLTGGITLHLIEDRTTVHLVDDAEYVTPTFQVDLFKRD